MPVFEKLTEIAVPATELAAWHHRAGAFERLLPPWNPPEVRQPIDRIEPGATGEFLISAGPIKTTWRAKITEVGPGFFIDEQVSGPFKSWRHEHRFEPVNDQRCRLRDRVEWEMPMWLAAGRSRVEADLSQLFHYRHLTTMNDLERHRPWLAGTSRVLVTGATGLVGGSLVPFLRALGVETWRLTRSPREPHDLGWDPMKGELDLTHAPVFDGVIHLAGANLADGRWTEERKRLIRESRTRGTSLLAKALARLPQPPKVLISASGANVYAPGPEPKTEFDPPGDDFLGKVCQEWEAATSAASKAGIRIVTTRTGVVLDPRGGALAKMMPIFKLGLGGNIGSGRQHLPWIALDDLLGLMARALGDDNLHGPVNAVAPTLTTNAAFTRALGSTLSRPAILPVPALAIKAAFGQMGEETLLADQPVVPALLQSNHYTFLWETAESALRHMLGTSHVTES